MGGARRGGKVGVGRRGRGGKGRLLFGYTPEIESQIKPCL